MADGGECSNNGERCGPLVRGERGSGGGPDDYVCPITAEIMTDPVSTLDGFT